MSFDDKTQIVAVGEVQQGTELNGIYRIDERIAVGGMGEIYRGHNIQTGDPVAIKIVLQEFARDETILALFRKEASVLNHLAHDAIVRYHVFSIDTGIGRPYLAMEFVDGESLADRAARTPLTFDEAVVMTAHLASGLQTAHDAGVVHRDLSPDNIILAHGEVSRAKIIDFGIAKAARIGGGTLIGGSFAGKYNFVSPEQLGLFGGEVTPKSDIYSLGLVVAAAVRGESLDMTGSQVEVIEKRRHVPELGRIDQRLQPILSAMLQPDPADRPASMAVVADQFRALAGDMPAAAPIQPPPPPPPAAQRMKEPAVPPRPPTREAKAKRGGSGLGLATVVLLLLVAGGGGAYYFLAGDPFGEPAVEAPDESDAPDLTPTTTPDLNPTPPVPDGDRPILQPRPSVVSPPGAETEDTDSGDRTPPTAAPTPSETRPASGADENQTPETTTPEPQPGSRPVDQAAAQVEWIDTFDGGPCFFARTREVGQNAIGVDGFGVNREPFERLDQGFKAEFGFEPDILLYELVENQCPVVDFLANVRPYQDSKPELVLSKDWIRSGDSLQGSIGNLGNRVASIYLIDNEGVVYNLGPHLQRVGDRAEFNIKLVELAPRDPLPQLILAVVSDGQIEQLRISSPVLARSYFPALLKALRAGNAKVGAALRYFRLGG